MVAFVPGIIWFIISLILLTLPGNELPEVGFFNIPHRDKIIHFILFFALCALFLYPVGKFYFNKNILITAIIIGCFAYGIAIEFVQKYCIPNRSFDVWDIVSDGAGCLLAYMFRRQCTVLIDQVFVRKHGQQIVD